MNSKYPHVFEPIVIRGVYYKNRIALAPPGSAGKCDERGFVTPAFNKWFAQYARGGAAIINIGNCSIDLSECNDEPGQMELISDGCIPALSTFAIMCKTYGAHGQLEVNHCGATQGNLPGSIAGENGIAPSAIVTEAERVRARAQGRPPLALREMSKEKIEETIQKYANAARRIKKAGMQTLIFHGAHGNLLAQFFSPYYNRRSDEYGGTIKNRARFASEMLDATRAAVGEDFVIEYRISADEFAEWHTHFPETLQFIDIIKDKIDILHVSGGLHDTQGEYWNMRPMVQPYMWDWMYNVHFAADIKKTFPNLKVTTVGSIKNIIQAEDIIASGKADFVAMMRAMHADPDMPRKYAEGREWDHRPCIRCACIYIDKYGGFSGPCTVNPYFGRIDEYPNGKVSPAPIKKKVAVIGGGPAGITAMQTLVERGHDVTLYEKSAEIGGNVKYAALLPSKKDIGQYLEYLKNQIQHTPAKVLLNTEATPELVAKENYDAIIVAIGSTPVTPDALGIDNQNIYWAPEAMASNANLGDDIIIVGGGAIGIEYAVHYAESGKRVTLLEITDKLTISGSSAGPLGGEYDLRESLKNERISVHFNTKLKSVSPNHALIENVATGIETQIPASAILLSAGMKPKSTEAQLFRPCAPATNVYLVGDCLDVNEIRSAVKTAFEVAAFV